MAKIFNNELDASVLLLELKEANNNMGGVINSIKGIAKQTNLLALNSAIEAARAGTAGRGFSVVAGEIKKLASKSMDTTTESAKLIDAIQQKANEVMAVRTADVAFDTIDKIDRNLFERNCDAQAWAGFDKVVSCFTKSNPERIEIASKLLKHLIEIYEVYTELFIIDLDGTIVAAGNNPDFIGRNMSDREWFINAKRDNCISVSDLYISTVGNIPAVAYTCPVTTQEGEVVGYFSTRFNWDYIYDIIDSARVGKNSDLWIINKEGKVIANRSREGILKDDLSQLEAVKRAVSGETYGYVLGNDKDGNSCIYGYAHTQGYNGYKGKNWSAIIRETI